MCVRVFTYLSTCVFGSSRTWRGKQPPRKRPWTSLEKGIIQKWMENDWLVIVEGLDDLYWMYSTVRSNAAVPILARIGLDRIRLDGI